MNIHDRRASIKAEDFRQDSRRPFTGAEYMESLRDGREVYINGERVEDVTSHPAMRNSVRSLARLYDALHDEKTKERLTSPTDTGSGGYTHKYFRVAKSSAELVAQHLARRVHHHRRAAEEVGRGGRLVTHEALSQDIVDEPPRPVPPIVVQRRRQGQMEAEVGESRFEAAEVVVVERLLAGSCAVPIAHPSRGAERLEQVREVRADGRHAGAVGQRGPRQRGDVDHGDERAVDGGEDGAEAVHEGSPPGIGVAAVGAGAGDMGAGDASAATTADGSSTRARPTTNSS